MLNVPFLGAGHICMLISTSTYFKLLVITHEYLGARVHNKRREY